MYNPVTIKVIAICIPVVFIVAILFYNLGRSIGQREIFRRIYEFRRSHVQSGNSRGLGNCPTIAFNEGFDLGYVSCCNAISHDMVEIETDETANQNYDIGDRLKRAQAEVGAIIDQY